MATITKIEEQKNKKRVNIFVDGAFFCGLNFETAVVCGLKKGKEVNTEELNEAIRKSEIKSAFEQASKYIGSRMHTKKELFDKLKQKGYEKAIILEAISKLEEYHYVDDALFAKSFVEQNSKYSKTILEGKLRQKGVDLEIIKNVLEGVSDDNEYLLCLEHMTKYIKTKDMSKEGAREKLFASLARKGFNFDFIKRAYSEIKNQIEIANDDNIDFYD